MNHNIHTDKILFDKVDRYISRCIDDAKAACNLITTDGPRYWFEIIDKDLVFWTDCVNNKVLNRIEYRLANNLEKNFGLKFHAVVSSGTQFGDHLHETCNYTFESEEDFSTETALCYRKIPGYGPFIICAKIGNWPEVEGVGTIIKLKKLMENGYNVRSHGHDRWISFCQAFMRTYRRDPMEAYLIMKANGNPAVHDLGDLMAKTDKDLEDHGCRYWSVCGSACDKCKDGCLLDKPVHRDGIVTALWMKMDDENFQRRIDAVS